MNRLLALLFLFLAVAATQAQSLPPSPALRAAVQLFEQGKFDDAVAKCDEAIASNPNDFRAHVILGSIYSAQRKMKQASDSFAHAIKLSPKTKEIYLMKARVDYLRNANDDAVAAAKTALEIDPKYPEAHLVVGSLLKYDTKRSAEAITSLKTALELNPKLLPAYEDLGSILEKDQPQEAEDWFRKGMAADPKRMAGRFALGRLMIKQGKLKEARELWEGRTYDTDNTYPQFIDVLKRAENLQRASDLLAQKPNDPDTLIDAGIAIMEGDAWVFDGRQARAIVLFQKALAAKPNYPRAQYQIVKAYIQIASVFAKENPNVDTELAKLRELDPKLAAEMDQYRREYKSGLMAAPVK